jgi:hypothetical protein
MVATVRSLGWTAAQNRDFRRYQAGQVIELTVGREQGCCFTVLGAERGRGLRARADNGAERFFTRRESSGFDVCEARPLELAVGDLILLRSGQKSPGHELINGERMLVTRLEGGTVYGRSIGADSKPAGIEKPVFLRNFTYAYASTSHRAQGMTVDVALVGLDRESLAQVDAKTLYVAGTRPRDELRVYVENKASLFAQAGRSSGERKAALEMEQQETKRPVRKRPMITPKRIISVASNRLRAAAHAVAVVLAHLREYSAICGMRSGLRHQQSAVVDPQQTTRHSIRL